MTKQYKPTPRSISGGPQYGDRIPSAIINSKHSGAVGSYTEKTYYQNHPLNSGVGPDILGADIEIKTRECHSTAPHTITTVPVSSIQNTEFNKSILRRKMQYQERVSWDRELEIYNGSKFYDFTDPEIQHDLENCYREIQNQLDEVSDAGGDPKNTTVRYGSLIVEVTNGMAKTRITHSSMVHYEKIASTVHTRRRLFELCELS